MLGSARLIVLNARYVRTISVPKFVLSYCYETIKWLVPEEDSNRSQNGAKLRDLLRLNHG